MSSHDDLHGFVRDALSRGIPRAEVETVLTRSGWGPPQVRAALAEFADVAFPIPVPKPRPYLDARDAFLYVVLFTTLYISAYNLGALIFEFINRTFPDPAFSARSAYQTSAIRWSLASRSRQAGLEGPTLADVPDDGDCVGYPHRRLHHACLLRAGRRADHSLHPEGADRGGHRR